MIKSYDKEVGRKSTEEKILGAATNVFAERGYQNTTTRMIAEAAGVNVALLHYYFRTKESLYIQALRRLFSGQSAALVALSDNVHDEASWKTALSQWLDRVAVLVSGDGEDGGVGARLYAHEMTNPTMFYPELVREFADPVMESLEKLIEKGLPKDDRLSMHVIKRGVWSLLTAPVLENEDWRSRFRPKGMTRTDWVAACRKRLAEPLFAMLKYGAVCLVATLSLCGCSNPGTKEREERSHELADRLGDETRQWIADHPEPLTFTNALALAHQRTLKITEQELEATLARTSRATAFSAFLPSVDVTYGRGISDVRSSGILSPMLPSHFDRLDYEGAALSISQPVFVPVAWIMFAESQYGVRIKDLVKERAIELMDVNGAQLFYRAAITARTVETFRRQIEADVEMTNRVIKLEREGYALPEDVEYAIAKTAADRVQLASAEADAMSAREKLCDVLRFWPLAELKIDGESLITEMKANPIAVTNVEEAVWTALVNRKELYIEDQMVELRKAQVLEALAGFLPNVFAVAGGNTLDIEKFAAHCWNGGAIAAWSLFSGFRTVQAYRDARARKEAEYRIAEDRALGVIVATLGAWRTRQLSVERHEAAKLMLAAARRECVGASRRFDEGQETFSKVLEKRTALDSAEVKCLAAEYECTLAEIMLKQSMGVKLL